MKVLFPSRIVDRHVGGNTTYARRIRDGIVQKGVDVGTIPSARTPELTALVETAFGQRRRRDTVLHFSADTGAIIPTRTPSVVTVHGVASRWISVARTPRQESVWRFRVARAIRSSQALITVSNAAAADVSHVFDVDPDRITVIRHGMEVPSGPAPEMSEDLRASLPRDYVLYLGNLEPRKNLVELVKAAELGEGGFDGVPLVIAGRPAWNFDETLEVIRSAKNVLYVGFVSESDRAALVAQAALFVFPSLYEGFGLPVLEALALGTPTVCSNRGALAEVAGPARSLDELDASALAVQIRSALGDRTWRAQIRETGPAWARGFDWDTSVDRHLDVYSGLVR